jgi:PAS domain-containing protein
VGYLSVWLPRVNNLYFSAAFGWWGHREMNFFVKFFSIAPFCAIIFFVFFIFLRNYGEMYDHFQKRTAKLFLAAAVFLAFQRIDVFVSGYPWSDFFVFAAVGLSACAVCCSRKVFVAAENIADTVVATIKNIVIILDASGHVAFANDTALKFLNYKKEEITGKSFIEICQDKDIIEALIGNADAGSKRMEFIGKNGLPLGVMAGATPVFERIFLARRIRGMVIVAQDIRSMEDILNKLKTQNRTLTAARKDLDKKAAELAELNDRMVEDELKIIRLKEKLGKLGGS